MIPISENIPIPETSAPPPATLQVNTRDSPRVTMSWNAPETMIQSPIMIRQDSISIYIYFTELLFATIYHEIGMVTSSTMELVKKKMREKLIVTSK